MAGALDVHCMADQCDGDTQPAMSESGGRFPDANTKSSNESLAATPTAPSPIGSVSARRPSLTTCPTSSPNFTSPTAPKQSSEPATLASATHHRHSVPEPRDDAEPEFGSRRSISTPCDRCRDSPTRPHAHAGGEPRPDKPGSAASPMSRRPSVEVVVQPDCNRKCAVEANRGHSRQLTLVDRAAHGRRAVMSVNRGQRAHHPKVAGSSSTLSLILRS